MSADKISTNQTAHYLGKLSWKFALGGFALLIFSSIYKSVLSREYIVLLDFLMGALFVSGTVLSLICLKLCIKDGFNGVKKSIILGIFINVPMVIIFIPNLMESSSKGMTKEQSISFGVFMSCENINKECPKLMGNNIRLDYAVPKGNEISYSCTILGQGDDEILKVKNDNMEKIKSQAATNEYIKKYLERGIKIRYELKNEKGIIMYDVFLSK